MCCSHMLPCLPADIFPQVCCFALGWYGADSTTNKLHDYTGSLNSLKVSFLILNVRNTLSHMSHGARAWWAPSVGSCCWEVPSEPPPRPHPPSAEHGPQLLPAAHSRLLLVTLNTSHVSALVASPAGPGWCLRPLGCHPDRDQGTVGCPGGGKGPWPGPGPALPAASPLPQAPVSSA